MTPETIQNCMISCDLCRRHCRVDRSRGQRGFCAQSDHIRAARAALHEWEEPCISGKTGSGAVFFSGCSMGCVFCQNREIALGEQGKEITPERLADVFLMLQDQGAVNINLVTPTHFVPQIVYALEQAKTKGMHLPVVYNTGNYETLETLRMLDGMVDVYLPDLKYCDPEISYRYAKTRDYFEAACENLEEMVRQVGTPVFMDENGAVITAGADGEEAVEASEAGLMKKGVLVRHLLLPGQTKDSLKILQYLHDTFGEKIWISLMNQYTPVGAPAFPELGRKLTAREYDIVIDHAIELGMEHVFIQEGDVAEESFIPPFDFTGLL